LSFERKAEEEDFKIVGTENLEQRHEMWSRHREERRRGKGQKKSKAHQEIRDFARTKKEEKTSEITEVV